MKKTFKFKTSHKGYKRGRQEVLKNSQIATVVEITALTVIAVAATAIAVKR